MKHYITPNSFPDQAIARFRSAYDDMMDPRHRDAFIREVQSGSDLIGLVREEIMRLNGYLTEIEDEAQARIDTDDLFDRLGGFA